ncbi:sulfotransferase 1C2-like [Haliotis rufescens]|uniref:sulfotransferase 1C2-like n=1 Tax=Haliotis rufescens TaxID=6454 RepID=UPI001EB036C1|nr:sulfotransferase 1C2-like [Haliotis rufescens]
MPPYYSTWRLPLLRDWGHNMAESIVTDKSGNTLTMLDVDGVWYPDPLCAETVRNIPNVTLRDDDIILYGYPRSGHHWLFEIVNMLVSGSADNVPFTLESGVLEVVPDADLQCLPSPRILTSHVQRQLMPKDLKHRNVKTVYIIRDPKDVAVSWFYYYRAFPNNTYKGSWDDWLHLFMSEKFMWSTWFDHIRSYEKECETIDPRFLHIVFYEDLKKDPHEEVRKLATFLDKRVTKDFIDQVVHKSTFSRMKSEKDKITDKWNENLAQYRKGAVGDWKNMFTPVQKAKFDDIYRKRMEGSSFQQRYESS